MFSGTPRPLSLPLGAAVRPVSRFVTVGFRLRGYALYRLFTADQRALLLQALWVDRRWAASFRPFACSGGRPSPKAQQV